MRFFKFTYVDSLSDFVKHGPCARFAKNMVYSDLPISLFHQFYSLHCALTWHLTFAAVFKWMLVKVGSFLQELLSFQILDKPNVSHTQMARKLTTIGGYICEFGYILITLHCTVHLPDTWHLLLSSNECYWKQAVFCRNLHRIGEPSRDIAC